MLESDFYFDLQFKFLGELYIHLKNAEQSYRLYLENGRKFLFAKMLKSSNDAILLLLGKYAYLLNDSLFRDSQQLTLHLSIWKEKWEELEKKSIRKMTLNSYLRIILPSHVKHLKTWKMLF